MIFHELPQRMLDGRRGGAGAFGAWKWLAPALNMTRGWGLGAVVAGGALAGNWLYGKLTGK